MLPLQKRWNRHLWIAVILCGIFVAGGVADAGNQQGPPETQGGLVAKQTVQPDSTPPGSDKEAVPGYRLTLVGVMDKIFSELESIQKDGDLSALEKKQKALDYIRVVRWGPEQKDYFYVFDLQGKMLMDPYIPDLVGKDLSAFVDQNGRPVFVDSIRICRQNGQGFIDFLWPKYEGKKPIRKIALVRLLKSWGWVIGTGVYLDTIEAYEVPEETGQLFIPLDNDDTPDDPASPT